MGEWFPSRLASVRRKAQMAALSEFLKAVGLSKAAMDEWLLFLLGVESSKVEMAMPCQCRRDIQRAKDPTVV